MLGVRVRVSIKTRGRSSAPTQKLAVDHRKLGAVVISRESQRPIYGPLPLAREHCFARDVSIFRAFPLPLRDPTGF